MIWEIETPTNIGAGGIGYQAKASLWYESDYLQYLKLQFCRERSGKPVYGRSIPSLNLRLKGFQLAKLSPYHYLLIPIVHAEYSAPQRIKTEVISEEFSLNSS
jgi:hypothetical protein